MKKSTRLTLLICIPVFALICTCMFLFTDSFVSEAAWTTGDTNSNDYEVVQLTDASDTKKALAPEFYADESKEKKSDPIINDRHAAVDSQNAVIEGIGEFQAGSTFVLVPRRNSDNNTGINNFHGENMSYTSTDTSVFTVGSAGQDGSVTVRVVGPGHGTIRWTYTYQRFYDTTETVTSSDGTVSSNAVRHVDPNSTISGELTGDVKPVISDSVHFMGASQETTLTTNVPNSVTSFSSRVSQGSNYIKSISASQGSDGFWQINVTARDALPGGRTGAVKIVASITSRNVVLTSEAYDITMVNELKLNKPSIEFNAQNYVKDLDNRYQASDGHNTEPLTATSDETEALSWYYYPDGTDTTDEGDGILIFASGDASTSYTGVEGLTIRRNGASLTFTTGESFLEPKDTYKRFTIQVRQTTSDGLTYKMDSRIQVDRPVKDLVMTRGTVNGPVVNSDQELYTGITYDKNGNGVTVDKGKLGNDPMIVYALLAGMGDTAYGDHSGTNGKTDARFYDFTSTPYNTAVTWKSSDENVIRINGDPQNHGYFWSCAVEAVGPGRATLTATADDGGFVGTISFTVRPYPHTVKFEPAVIEIDQMTSNADQLDLSHDVSVTSNYGDYGSKKVSTVSADATLDRGLVWSTINGGSIGSVDSNGLLTYTAPGTITVEAVSSVSHGGEFSEIAPFGTITINIKQPVDSVKITNAPEDPVDVGRTIALRTQILPENATDQTLTWSSSDTSRVSVDSEGRITTLAPTDTGGVTITVQTSNGRRDTCRIVVRRMAQSISLNRTEAEVSRGKKITLSAEILPEDTTDKTVTWSSSDRKIATVSDKGVVTGVAVSTDPAIISATTSNGKVARCYVYVREPATGVKVSPKKKTMWVGRKYELKTTVYPLNNSAVNQNVTYKSSNEDVAEVSEKGVVTPKRGGKCTVTVTTADGGYTAKCDITVKEKVSSIELNQSDVSLQKGKSFRLKATVLTKYATNKKIRFKSSNKKTATVSKSGTIKANKIGKAKITVTARDGSGVKAVCNVRVVKRVKKLKLNKYYITLIRGYRYKSLKAKVTPKSATNRKLRWSSSNPGIVSVNKNTGTMFAESSGDAYISVKTTDGSNLKKRCRVHVIDPVPISELKITQSEITLTAGSSSRLETRTMPTNTTASISWMTDDRTIATVSNTGLVKAVKPGTTTITAYTTSADDPGTMLESQCTVHVIEMDPTELTMEQYDTYTLTVNGAVTGGTGANAGTVTWNSSNPDVVSVDTSGRITGKAVGSAVVTATYNGKHVSCTVTVRPIG